MLEFENVTVNAGGRKILDNVSFSLQPHKITALLGKNGSGKSTLVSCVNGAVPYTGRILFSGTDIKQMSDRERARTVSVLPQLLPGVHMSAYDIVAMGRAPYLSLGQRLSGVDREMISDALRMTGTEAFSDRFADELSGGERQKIFIAMTLAQDTRVLLLDEPSAYLDETNTASFMQTLSFLKKDRKKTVLAVMHDLSDAVFYADNITVLDSGKVAFCGSSEKCVSEKIIEEIFGVKTYFCKNGEDGRIFFAPL